MRDPLARIPIRYKLPLTFGFLCLVALALGGYVVTTTARASLREQIQLRLNEGASTLNLVVDQSLNLLGRRVEDFASDGFIRQQLEMLVEQPDGFQAEDVRARLTRHLRNNKLPLVEEFVDAFLLDVEGRRVLVAHAARARPRTDFDRAGLWIGPLEEPGPTFEFPRFIVSTPVSSLEGGVRLGYLQLVVRSDTWARKLEDALALPGATGFHAQLSSQGGGSLPLVAGLDPVSSETAARIDFSSTVERADWRLNLAVDAGVFSIPLNALVWNFLNIGMVLVALTLGLLLFPQQFLLKPLSALQDAARRIAEGDFSARVDPVAGDEVGDLGVAFNFMADAVEERTRSLEHTATILERRESDIRFERDRLNTVIRSMEDGLFILDKDGRITLSNVAARPVIEALSTRSGEIRMQCHRRVDEPAACLNCIKDFSNDVQGCAVNVDEQIYEINGAVLSGPHEAIAGKVFVSRNVTARVRQSEQQAHQERLSVLGEIAAVMAHELNNPLAAISMFSQMMLKGLDSRSGLRSHAEVIHRNTESCKATIRALLDMATTPTAEAETFDTSQLIADVSELLGPVAHRAGVIVADAGQAEQPDAFGDELQLRQAVVNLVMNAIQSAAECDHGKVTVSSEDRGDRVAILVCDDGPGISPESREHIFEPFFTTKPPGEGTGLGLSTSRRIVQAQGGSLSLIDSEPGRTVFEIVVPREIAARTAPPPVRFEPLSRLEH